MWLAPLVSHYGWPFDCHDEPPKGSNWFYALGRIKLKDWQTFRWKLHEIDFASTPLSPYSTIAIQSMVKRCVGGLETEIAEVAGSEERFRACADFIRKNGRIPKPVVGIVRNGHLEIVDGTHRLAALVYVGIPIDYMLPVWLPSP
jgi:hypothetical protein